MQRTQKDAMKRSIGPRLAWYARQATRAIGLPGLTGAGLLMATLLFYATAVWPLAQEAAGLQREMTAQEAAQKSAPLEPQQSPADASQQLVQFYRFFPRSTQAPDDLARLHGLAAAHQVQLEQGTYRMVRDRAGKLALYEVTLPVKGEYPQVRRFMAQALTELPHLALDGISFQRQKVADAMLESQIKLTLFFGQPS